MKKLATILVILLFISCTSVRNVRNFAKLHYSNAFESGKSYEQFRFYHFIEDQPSFPLFQLKRIKHSSGVADYPVIYSSMIVLGLKNGKVRFLKYPTGKEIGEIKMTYGIENEIHFRNHEMIIPNALGNFALRFIRFPDLKEIKKVDEKGAGKSFMYYNQYAVYVDLAKILKVVDLSKKEIVVKYKLDREVLADPILRNNILTVLSQDGWLYRFSFQPFRLLKKIKLHGTFVADMLAIDSVIYMFSKEGFAYRIDSIDQVRQITDKFPPVVVVPAYHPREKLLIVGSLDHRVYGYKLPELREVWHFETGSIITASPVCMQKGVWAGSWDGLVYFLDVNGQLVHKIDVKTPVTGALFWFDRYLYFDTLKKGFFIYGETRLE